VHRGPGCNAKRITSSGRHSRRTASFLRRLHRTDAARLAHTEALMLATNRAREPSSPNASANSTPTADRSSPDEDNQGGLGRSECELQEDGRRGAGRPAGRLDGESEVVAGSEAGCEYRPGHALAGAGQHSGGLIVARCHDP
jgi:hypothetical protein